MHQHQSGLPVQLLHSTHWPLPVRRAVVHTHTRIAEIKRIHARYGAAMRVQAICIQPEREIERERGGVRGRERGSAIYYILPHLTGRTLI